MPDLRHPHRTSRCRATGFNIYRVRFDGAQMELMENVSETTGLGLGVHVTIDPKNAESLFRHRWAEGHRGVLRPAQRRG